MKVSPEGRDFLKRLEGLRLRPYRCSAGRLTIGYGSTGPHVRLGMVLTREEAEELLTKDLASRERDVLFLTRGCALTQNQFDALVSFTFNVGSDIDADRIPEGLGDSTLLRKLLAGDVQGAADAFLAWDKERDPKTGLYRRNEGLATRRSKERALFLSGSLLQVEHPDTTTPTVRGFTPLDGPKEKAS